jgi:hypothetical protein
MSASESDFSVARQLLGNFLTELVRKPSWWYVIDTDEDDTVSLVSLCGSTRGELHSFSELVGVARTNKKGVFSVSRDKLQALLDQFKLDNQTVELETCLIPSYSNKVMLYEWARLLETKALMPETSFDWRTADDPDLTISANNKRLSLK